ncbi:unnamed protein product [Auanema sp. JU1783]|nr:unnamed protein product [Auanema sp. JU1783]
MDDVDALLEDALDPKKSVEGNDSKENSDGGRRPRSRSPSDERRKQKGSSSRDHRRSSSRDQRKRSRSRDKKRSRSRDRDRRGGYRRSRSRSYERRRRRSRSRDRPRVLDHRDRRSPRRRLPGPERRDVMPFTARTSPPKNARTDLSPEERDHRTLFILQIARQTRPRDLEEFFSSVGAVRDVRIITDSRTGRSKGIAYVEFWEEESVNLGLALHGQKLLGAPLVIQRTCAERNRAANATATVGSALGFGPANSKGPCKLQIVNLHPNISESMLESVFEPFGHLQHCRIRKEAGGVGVGFVTFAKTEDGTKAAEQLNGFELAGNNIRVSILDEEDESAKQRSLDDIMEDKQGIALGGQGGRIQLMAKLAQGTGIELSQQAQQTLQTQQAQQNDPSIPSIATQCFMLSNMFDPVKETEPSWEEDVKQDVIEECAKNGGALHVYVDKASAQGNVYVKCPSVTVAHRSVTALHGRWFSGKIITANYVPVNSYHDLFPEALSLTTPIAPRPYGSMPSHQMSVYSQQGFGVR